MTGTTDVREWINATLDNGINKEETLAQALKSGVVLCNLMNKISPGIIKTINPNDTSVAYRENIGSFLRSCQSLGFDECRLFDISDLYDERNINQVVNTLTMLQTFSSNRHSISTSFDSSYLGSSSPPYILRRAHSARASDAAFHEALGEQPHEAQQEKKEKKKAKHTLEKIFFRKSTSIPKFTPPLSPLSSSLSPPPSPKTSLRESSGSPPASSSYTLSRVQSESMMSEATRLREDLEKLHEDRKILKERVGFSYPDKYKGSVVFEDYVKKESELTISPPTGVNEIEYLKQEEGRMLGDIFTLTSMLAIVEENRGLRIRMAELQKMVDAMVAEKKQMVSRVDELLVPSPTPDSAVETDGIILSDWKGKSGEIKGGTAEKLVERLYTTSIAGSVSEYVDFFLLTYRSFITPNKVMEMLTQTFLINRTPADAESDDSTTAIQLQQEKLIRLRICNFLKRWVEVYYEQDFDQDLMSAFSGFIDACQEDTLVVLLKKTIEKKIRRSNTSKTIDI